ncbi:MAG: DUF6029 family protein [Rikenellaceae bacterium]
MKLFSILAPTLATATLLLCGQDALAAQPSLSDINSSEQSAVADSTENSATEKKKKDYGKLTGSFESNTIYYMSDDKTGAVAPSPAYGSNNYLKLDYKLGGFSAGIQIEYYPHVIQGYDTELEGIGIPMKYLSYQATNWSVTVGDYYEQFGSGLLFRSWEDRQLGFNNSIGGARATYNTKDNTFAAKLIYGFPRDYLHSTGSGYDFAGSLFNDYTSTQIFGADMSLSISNLLFPKSDHSLTIEGSGLYRLEDGIPENLQYLNDVLSLGLRDDLFSYSARAQYQWQGFSFKGEYVGKGKDLYTNPKTYEDELKAGNAQLVELSYSQSGFTVLGAFRRLENMEQQIYRTTDLVLPANTLNYIPALVQPQTYMLAAYNPYVALGEGEMGGQLDVFYNFKRGSSLGGKYGFKVHANASVYYALASTLKNYDNDNLAYYDVNINLDKTWTKNFKTKFLYSHQQMSVDHGNSDEYDVIDVAVLEGIYKFTRKFSMRLELQYLFSDDLEKDWVAALLEANFAPRWSVYASDMYNHGDTKVHYYSVGASYTYSILRVAASFGRNREGVVCSGGVCRMQPAYTGANLQLTLLF